MTGHISTGRAKGSEHARSGVVMTGCGGVEVGESKQRVWAGSVRPWENRSPSFLRDVRVRVTGCDRIEVRVGDAYHYIGCASFYRKSLT